METHSSILAWEMPCTEEPGGLQSMGSQRNWTRLSDSTSPASEFAAILTLGGKNDNQLNSTTWRIFDTLDQEWDYLGRRWRLFQLQTGFEL